MSNEHDESRILVRNLREALAYSLALERAARACTPTDRQALRRLLTRAAQERGPQVSVE